MSLKNVSIRLEQRCQVKHLLVFQHQSGSYRSLLPVITEHVRTNLDYGPEGQYEFFRARATHPGAVNANFHSFHNQVSVTVCHVTKMVKFGPIGQLIMAQRGIGLGPSLMARVVGWLTAQRIPDYGIEPGSLSPVDASTEKDRLQRNRFYLAFGFRLSNWNGTQTSLEVVEGSFTADKVGDLSVPTRYQDRLQDWPSFELNLRDERWQGVENLSEHKLIDEWTYGKSWFGRKLLKFWGWPIRYATRHLHPLKPWETRS
ncbi:hypothetical protein [Pseudomonas chlororaphis]|uniref:Uncharacterized protein n=1 Tax=Pseudomonas chlororaphis subsp. aurantiaca TaxID=86192 RepID=A0AAJ1E391_9PSED|nr:hypothetical protein [Pseudomonas chlororaphis]MBU4634043.1 hypothetical protein [Pseudomonas chlororaphis subsp. aurantiaca]